MILTLLVLIGPAVTAFPVFATQRAISMLPTMTVAKIAASGRLAVFALPFVERRVAYSPATMTGQGIDFVGALHAAFGGTRPARSRTIAS